MVAASVLTLIDLVALLDSQIVGIAIDMTVGLHLPERHIVRVALLYTPVENSFNLSPPLKEEFLEEGRMVEWYNPNLAKKSGCFT